MKPVDEIPEMGNAKSKLEPEEISLGKILVQKYRSKEFDIGDILILMLRSLEN